MKVDLSLKSSNSGLRSGYITLRNGRRFWARWIEEDQDREGIWIVDGLRSIWYRQDGTQFQTNPDEEPANGLDIVAFEPKPSSSTED